MTNGRTSDLRRTFQGCGIRKEYSTVGALRVCGGRGGGLFGSNSSLLLTGLPFHPR